MRSLTTALAVFGAASRADPSGDAAAACAGLNLTQQISLMFGVGQIDGYSRNSGCAGVCGRRTYRWDNGPQGFGDGTKPGTSTQWPSSLSAAATFDPDLIEAWGVAMGEEFWGKGTNIQEGPGVNVARIQKNGRNFEYMSGVRPRPPFGARAPRLAPTLSPTPTHPLTPNRRTPCWGPTSCRAWWTASSRT